MTVGLRLKSQGSLILRPETPLALRPLVHLKWGLETAALGQACPVWSQAHQADACGLRFRLVRPGRYGRLFGACLRACNPAPARAPICMTSPPDLAQRPPP